MIGDWEEGKGNERENTAGKRLEIGTEMEKDSSDQMLIFKENDECQFKFN